MQGPTKQTLDGNSVEDTFHKLHLACRETSSKGSHANTTKQDQHSSPAAAQAARSSQAELLRPAHSRRQPGAAQAGQQ